MRKFETYAKCIIAGEHAVLRGHPAIVFPVKSKNLIFEYIENNTPLTCNFEGTYKEEIKILFWAALERALELCTKKRDDFMGSIRIVAEIPIGTGLGASAALCTAITQLLHFKGWVSSENIFETSRLVENLFHGESSGVDITVSLLKSPVYYIREKPPLPLLLNWKPQLFLSYSGSIGTTFDCVKKVKALFETNATFAKKLDLNMADSVQLVKRAFETPGEVGLELLAQGLTKAHSCFQEWGLLTSELKKEMNNLIKFGAIATKPTGSGSGGYVLSLWKTAPPKDLASRLIPLDITTY